jgi:transposase
VDTIFMQTTEPNAGTDAPKQDAPYVQHVTRRDYQEWFKAQVVEECAKPGSSVSIVARRHDINSNVLFRWRREYQLGHIRRSQRPKEPSNFIPAGVIGADGKLVPGETAKSAITASEKSKPPAVTALPAPAPHPAQPKPGIVEIHLCGRVKMIRIQGDIHKEALVNILTATQEFA